MSTYEVESILDHRVRGTRYQYFLKWKGFDESENSWEDEKNLEHLALLAKYKTKNNIEKTVTTPGPGRPRKTNSNQNNDNNTNTNTTGVTIITRTRSNTTTIQNENDSSSSDHKQKDSHQLRRTPSKPKKTLADEEQTKPQAQVQTEAQTETETSTLKRRTSSRAQKKIYNTDAEDEEKNNIHLNSKTTGSTSNKTNQTKSTKVNAQTIDDSVSTSATLKSSLLQKTPSKSKLDFKPSELVKPVEHFASYFQTPKAFKTVSLINTNNHNNNSNTNNNNINNNNFIDARLIDNENKKEDFKPSTPSKEKIDNNNNDDVNVNNKLNKDESLDEEDKFHPGQLIPSGFLFSFITLFIIGLSIIECFPLSKLKGDLSFFFPFLSESFWEMFERTSKLIQTFHIASWLSCPLYLVAGSIVQNHSRGVYNNNNHSLTFSSSLTRLIHGVILSIVGLGFVGYYGLLPIEGIKVVSIALSGYLVQDLIFSFPNESLAQTLNIFIQLFVTVYMVFHINVDGSINNESSGQVLTVELFRGHTIILLWISLIESLKAGSRTFSPFASSRSLSNLYLISYLILSWPLAWQILRSGFEQTLVNEESQINNLNETLSATIIKHVDYLNLSPLGYLDRVCILFTFLTNIFLSLVDHLTFQN